MGDTRWTTDQTHRTLRFTRSWGFPVASRASRLLAPRPPHHGVPAGRLAWAETLDLIVIALWLCRVTEDGICEVAMYRIPFTVSE